ncbi:hypothetical protein [Woodsholea maritima]|uniref:hypothetical protein n=1 Tax=Woodsholea maritima TaxID=240237 RepID=UPI000381CEC0|nr:hypothetical protein [Woodsholea maritima]
MGLTRLTLRVGRNPDAGFPEGDDHRGYVIMAPLDGDGRLDADVWRTRREDCTVVRFSPDADEKADGWLTHRGSNWYFHYDEDREGPDEPVYKLGDHTLRLGDYITIHEADGDDLVHKITEATPIA